MKVKDFFKLLMVYILLFLAGVVLYVLGLRSGAFDGIPVFFYRGIAAIIAAGIIISFIMIVLRSVRMKKIITIRDILLLFCLFCCINIVIFTHLPVTADRSVSVFMLGYMDNKGSDCTKQELEDVFVQKYVREYKAFDKRLAEQLYTGTIEVTADGSYILTEPGRRIIDIYETVADLFKIDKKLIDP